MEILLLNFSLFLQVSFWVLTSSHTSSHMSALYSLLTFLLICSQSHWKKHLKKIRLQAAEAEQKRNPVACEHIA